MKYILSNGIWSVVLSGALIALGVFLFVFGGYDDSPGAQLLGFLVAAFGVRRAWRRRSSLR